MSEIRDEVFPLTAPQPGAPRRASAGLVVTASVAAAAVLTGGVLAAGIALGVSLVRAAPVPSQPQPTATVTAEVPAVVDTRTCRDVAATLWAIVAGDGDAGLADQIRADYERCVNP